MSDILTFERKKFWLSINPGTRLTRLYIPEWCGIWRTAKAFPRSSLAMHVHGLDVMWWGLLFDSKTLLPSVLVGVYCLQSSPRFYIRQKTGDCNAWATEQPEGGMLFDWVNLMISCADSTTPTISPERMINPSHQVTPRFVLCSVVVLHCNQISWPCFCVFQVQII